MLKVKELNKSGRILFALSMVLISAGALLLAFNTYTGVATSAVQSSAIASSLAFVSITAGVVSSCVTCSKAKKLKGTNTGVIISWLSYGVGVGTIIASSLVVAFTIVGIAATLFFLFSIVKAVVTAVL